MVTVECGCHGNRDVGYFSREGVVSSTPAGSVMCVQLRMRICPSRPAGGACTILEQRGLPAGCAVGLLRMLCRVPLVAAAAAVLAYTYMYL